jgi:probable O-glycosylation ligase (exosortase A-associated)
VRFTHGVGGMIGDNNDFALALNMAIPILVYLTWDLEKRWLRMLCLALVPMTAITVVFTHSRGGFLSLAALTLVLVLNSRRKFLTLFTVAALVMVGSFVVPKTFYERIASIGDFHSDGSAMGRLNAWQASIRMANDYPIAGVGLDNFLFEFIYYAPDPDDIHVAHNTWFQVLAEAGYVGLTFYLTLFGATWWTLWRVHRRARRFAVQWARNAAACLGASLLAFMVGATFLNRAHFDLIYHVMVLVVCVDRILELEIRNNRITGQDDDEDDESDAGTDGEIDVWDKESMEALA